MGEGDDQTETRMAHWRWIVSLVWASVVVGRSAIAFLGPDVGLSESTTERARTQPGDGGDLSAPQVTVTETTVCGGPSATGIAILLAPSVVLLSPLMDRRGLANLALPGTGTGTGTCTGTFTTATPLSRQVGVSDAETHDRLTGDPQDRPHP